MRCCLCRRRRRGSATVVAAASACSPRAITTPASASSSSSSTSTSTTSAASPASSTSSVHPGKHVLRAAVGLLLVQLIRVGAEGILQLLQHPVVPVHQHPHRQRRRHPSRPHPPPTDCWEELEENEEEGSCDDGGVEGCGAGGGVVGMSGVPRKNPDNDEKK